MDFNIYSRFKVEYDYLALIDQAGSLYGRILTEVLSSDRMQ